MDVCVANSLRRRYSNNSSSVVENVYVYCLLFMYVSKRTKHPGGRGFVASTLN